MNIIKGDLLQLADAGEFDAIIHGCNCFCAMGAGIALQIKTKYPAASEADKNTIQGHKGKLGTYTSAQVGDLTIINAYTQYMPGLNDLKENYSAIHNVMKKIAVDFQGKRIGLPFIGAGLAGGDWNIIKDIISANLEGMIDYTIVEYSKS